MPGAGLGQARPSAPGCAALEFCRKRSPQGEPMLTSEDLGTGTFTESGLMKAQGSL